MSDDSNAVISTENLSKKYGNFVALRNVSISLDRGQILGLIGPNGAGKTTTIKILVGLIRPTKGTARIAGVDCFRDSRKLKTKVGYMPDKFGSYDNMRVLEYLDFFGAAFKIGRKARIKRIDEVMEITGADKFQDKYVEALSHGMQQRVGIARTLLHDPDVLIFDEPANGLDPLARIEMRELLLKLAKSGKTLIVSSHVLPELSRICDKIAILIRGELRAYGTLQDIMKEISEKRTIEVQLQTVEQLEPAAELVRTRLNGDGTDVSISPAESMLRFQSDKSEGELSALLATLIGEGIRVSQFRELQTDLEDAFLSVTREQHAPPKAAVTE